MKNLIQRLAAFEIKNAKNLKGGTGGDVGVLVLKEHGVGSK